MNIQNSFYLSPSHQRQLESLLANNMLNNIDYLDVKSNYSARECIGSCKGGCSCENGGTMTFGYIRECIGSCKGGCSCENGGTMTFG